MAQQAQETSSPPPPHLSPDEPPAKVTPLAAELVTQQWRNAANQNECAPITFAGDGGAEGTARPANFSGGWAIAFDQPDRRGAYGVAGPGLVPADEADPEAQVNRLMSQWPHFKQLPQLPEPAFAGYGRAGATAYSPRNPEGYGERSLAYVRIGDQGCTYNVWSDLGRAHLEALLDSLTML